MVGGERGSGRWSGGELNTKRGALRRADLRGALGRLRIRVWEIFSREGRARAAS